MPKLWLLSALSALFLSGCGRDSSSANPDPGPVSASEQILSKFETEMDEKLAGNWELVLNMESIRTDVENRRSQSPEQRAATLQAFNEQYFKNVRGQIGRQNYTAHGWTSGSKNDNGR